MTNKSWEDLRVNLEQLEALFPGSLKNPQLKELATAQLLSEFSFPAAPKRKALPESILDDNAFLCVDPVDKEEDEQVTLKAYWETNFSGEMERSKTLQDACKNAYQGAFGGLPEKVDEFVPNRFGGRMRDAYAYPKKWLAEFLEIQRQNFPDHWKNCEAG